LLTGREVQAKACASRIDLWQCNGTESRAGPNG
jgi:hypothetical protein